MSRRAAYGARPADSSTLGSMGADDMCPICKTNRYIKKDLEFLFNPECYHQMCSNCVNRLFNDAPAQCPTAGCTKTLRRRGFRAAFFGDLSVEREVDIRRRVAAIFNRTEDEFEDLDAYNDYLQMVEDLTTSLVHGTEHERREAEATLAQWAVEHRAEIERNRRAGQQATLEERKRLEADRQASARKRMEVLREIEEEKMRRKKNEQETLDELAKAPEGQVRIVLKRRARIGDGRKDGQQQPQTKLAEGLDDVADVGKLSIRGLKKEKKPAAPQGPYDPFGGADWKPARFEVTDDLVNPWAADPRLDSTIVAGGYDFMEYTTRAMFEAFEGLGVFIDEEKGNGSTTVKKEEGGSFIKMEVDEVGS